MQTSHSNFEKIANAVKGSTVGMRNAEIIAGANINATEAQMRDLLKEMTEKGYLERSGVCATTRYKLTPQGRLMFVANSENEIVEEFIAEKNQHESIDAFEERIFEDVEQIEATPCPQIEDFETRKIPTESLIDDLVNNPKHYQGNGMKCIDVIDAFFTPEMIKGFMLGNVVKYILRHGEKEGVQSLKKAQWYLNRTIQKHG